MAFDGADPFEKTEALEQAELNRVEALLVEKLQACPEFKLSKGITFAVGRLTNPLSIGGCLLMLAKYKTEHSLIGYVEGGRLALGITPDQARRLESGFEGFRRPDTPDKWYALGASFRSSCA